MTEHTRLPWDFDGNCGGYISQDGEKIARAYSLRDAEFIVQAVNSYPEMREALEGLLAHEKTRAARQGWSDCRCIGYSRNNEQLYETGRCPHQIARKALATDREVKE